MRRVAVLPRLLLKVHQIRAVSGSIDARLLHLLCCLAMSYSRARPMA